VRVNQPSFLFLLRAEYVKFFSRIFRSTIFLIPLLFSIHFVLTTSLLIGKENCFSYSCDSSQEPSWLRDTFLVHIFLTLPVPPGRNRSTHSRYQCVSPFSCVGSKDKGQKAREAASRVNYANFLYDARKEVLKTEDGKLRMMLGTVPSFLLGEQSTGT
jgi:hypothetical protein